MDKPLNAIVKSIVEKKKARDVKQAEQLGVDVSQGSPLVGIRQTGNIEEDDKAEAEVVLTALQKRNQAVPDQMNPDYYMMIVFSFGEQGRAFLEATGWSKFIVNNEHGCYFDGVALARHLGIVLPDRKVRFHEETEDARLVSEVGLL